MVGTNDRSEDLIADRVRAAGTRRSYPARSFIFHEADESSGVLLIESGLARIDRTAMSGKVVLLDLASTGRVVGELGVIDDQPRSATISTITDVVAHHVPAARFREMLASDNPLQGAVLSSVAQRLRVLSTQFVETAIMDAPARIAARLVALVAIQQALGDDPIRPDGSADLKLPISQEELGQWSGLSREGAVKGLGTLKSIGLIETGRKRVLINDVARLAAQADGS